MSPSPPHRARPRRMAVLIVAAIQSLMSAALAHADERLGRLFFTPEERQQLEQQRETETPGRQQESASTGTNSALTLDGVVTRSHGKQTLWINGIPSSDGIPGMRATPLPDRQPPGEVVIRRSGSATAHLKVGDTIDRQSGKITPLLGAGHVTKREALR